ncbi:MAG: TrkH family potassium uptake protein [Desulfobacteraceae bacterium]
MHARTIINFIGALTLVLGLSMAAPLAVSLAYDDGSARALVFSMALTLAAGLILIFVTRRREPAQLNHRDGALIVAAGWAAAGLVGTLPYILSGSIPVFTNAYFESISGFTTTGASILSDIERLPEGILLWRSQTQWFGGMGIIVLSVAILPLLGVGGMQLYKAEVPSPVVDKLKPRISETAKTLWKVYILITMLEVLLLLGGGMPLFEAVCHAFCTMPTGGFSPNNASIAHYNSAYTEVVILVFMLLAGINFSLHYRFMTGQASVFGKDPEFKVFIGIFVVFTAVVTVDILGPVYGSLTDALRYSSFQVGSILTTTGFVTADYDQWPTLSRNILLLCMFLGGMAGSTGGGIKIMRVVLLVKHIQREIFRVIHPRAVTTVKLGGRPIPNEVLSSVVGFFLLFISIFIAAVLCMSALGLDMVSAIASVAASIGNIGPGLAAVGPVRNYLEIPMAGKWILTFCMLLGRLEIYTVIVLLMPGFWKK